VITIRFYDYIPTDKTNLTQIGVGQNNDIDPLYIEFYSNSSFPNFYDVNFYQQGGVYANPNSNYLFNTVLFNYTSGGYPPFSIDFTNFKAANMISASYFFRKICDHASVSSISITGFEDDFGQNLENVYGFFYNFGSTTQGSNVSLHIDDFPEHFCENFTGNVDARYFAYTFCQSMNINQNTFKPFQLNDNFFINANSINCEYFFWEAFYSAKTGSGDNITINFKMPAAFGKNMSTNYYTAAFKNYMRSDNTFSNNNTKIFDFSNCNYVKQYNSSNANDFSNSAYAKGYGTNIIKWNGDETNEKQVYYFKNLNFNGNTVIFDPPFSIPIPDGFTYISEFNWSGFTFLSSTNYPFDFLNENVIVSQCFYNPAGAVSTAKQYDKILLFFINDDGEFLAFKETSLSGESFFSCLNSPFIFPDGKYHLKMVTSSTPENYTIGSSNYEITSNSGIYSNISDYNVGGILFLRSGKDYNDQFAICTRYQTGWGYPRAGYNLNLPNLSDLSSLTITSTGNIERFALTHSFPLEIKNSNSNSLFHMALNPFNSTCLLKSTFDGTNYTNTPLALGQSLPYPKDQRSISNDSGRLGNNFAYHNFAFQARTTDGPVNQYLFIVSSSGNDFAVTKYTTSSFGKTGNFVGLVTFWSKKNQKEMFLFCLSSENGTFLAETADPLNTFTKISESSLMSSDTPNNIINSTLYTSINYSAVTVTNLSEYF
jgi:hypothetical protein